MADQECQHLRTVTGMVELDFARPSSPNAPLYTAPLSVSICEDCGHTEFWAKSHTMLCTWLKGGEGHAS
jgi:hypothetical protein